MNGHLKFEFRAACASNANFFERQQRMSKFDKGSIRALRKKLNQLNDALEEGDICLEVGIADDIKRLLAAATETARLVSRVNEGLKAPCRVCKMTQQAS